MNAAKKLSVSTSWSRLAKNAELCLASRSVWCVCVCNKAEAANYNFNLFGARTGTLGVGSAVGGVWTNRWLPMHKWVCATATISGLVSRPRLSNRIKIRERKCSRPKVVVAF